MNENEEPCDRPFEVISELDRPVILTAWLRPEQLRLDLVPNTRAEGQRNAAEAPPTEPELLEFVAEDLDGKPLDEDDELTPDTVVGLYPGVPLLIKPDDHDMAGWEEDSELDVHCLINASGFGHMVRGRTVCPVDGSMPTLILERETRRGIRIKSGMPFPILVAFGLKPGELVVELRYDKGGPTAFGQQLATQYDAEPCPGELVWGVKEAEIIITDPNNAPDGALIVQPCGFFTIILDDENLPRWLMPKELLKYVDFYSKMDKHPTYPELVINDVDEEWPTIIITPESSCLS